LSSIEAAQSVLEVLQREGYIRGFTWSEARSSIAEFTIELKYDEGTPVIKEITRVSKPAAASTPRSRICEGLWRSRDCHPVDAARRHVGCGGPRRQCRRRNPLSGVLGQVRREIRSNHVAYRKEPVAIPTGVNVAVAARP